MPTTPLNEIVPVLQVAIGPVILISGVGLLLLTMTSRLGRTIDRARLLKAELSKRTDEERAQALAQVAILYRRARVVRLSIILATLSALLASALIAFICDINLSLRALKLELKGIQPGPG